MPMYLRSYGKNRTRRSQNARARGLKKVQAKLDDAVLGIQGRTLDGVVAGAGEILREAEPLTPIRTGHLIESYTITFEKTQIGPVAVLANTAKYAPIVHELFAKFKRPGARRKFLEIAAYRSGNKVVEAVQKRARIQ